MSQKENKSLKVDTVNKDNSQLSQGNSLLREKCPVIIIVRVISGHHTSQYKGGLYNCGSRNISHWEGLGFYSMSSHMQGYTEPLYGLELLK